jgi:hypothetical protein
MWLLLSHFESFWDIETRKKNVEDSRTDRLLLYSHYKGPIVFDSVDT